MSLIAFTGWRSVKSLLMKPSSIICSTTAQVAIFTKFVYSLMFESPTITCRRRNFSRSACGSSRVLMIERSLVVVPLIFW